jgi:hydrogenase nickel incorporation protein HypA/HybF
MHEYHLVEDIVKKVLESAAQNHAVKVTKVNLVVGELSGLAESSVRLYFESLSKGTIAEQAKLVITPLPAKLQCKYCGFLFVRKKGEFDCPQCGKPAVPTEIGKEFYIKDIEVEE